MKKIFILFVIIFSSSSWISAQTQKVKMDCATDHYHEKIKLENPAAFQAWTRANEAVVHNSELMQNSAKKTTEEGITYIIPIVVHVIWESNEEKITIEQVKSQFEPLNFDYRKVPGTTGWGQGVDMNIEFCLASIDEKGNPTTGVNYVKSPVTDLAKYDDETLKKLSRWNPNRYLNVYIVKAIGGSGGGGTILGYAFFPYPDNYNKNQDGVVINHSSWGTIGTARSGTSGRVAPHEFGHYLSLFHPFQDGCVGNTSNCGKSGDYVCDTPPSKTQNFGTPDRLNSCGNEDTDKPDNTRNYMDYSDDDSKDMFTKLQRIRAHSVLDNPSYAQRFDLYSNVNHKRTGVGKYGKPTAHFWSKIQNTCSNQEIKFTDHSFNTPDKYFWSFPGGSPSTSTEREPVVKYDKPGKYSVTLKVLNESHPNDTSTNVKNNFITIQDTVMNTPFVEGFNKSFPPKGWHVINDDFANTSNNKTFELSPSMGGFAKSNGCAWLRYFFYNGYGQKDYFVSPSISLKGMKNAKFSFAVSYRPQYVKSNTPMLFSDSLAVWISSGCDNKWERVYYKGGRNLATSKLTEESILIPNDVALWRKDSIDISKYITSENIKFRFEGINGSGNHMFIDDISILDQETKVSREDELANNLQATVMPNPFNNTSVLRIDLEKNAKVAFKIFDIQGREVYHLSQFNAEAGEVRLPFEIKGSGIYILRLEVDGQKSNIKVVNID